MIRSAPGESPPEACSASPRSPACHHLPRCPAATAPDRDAARTVAAHPEQGWSLLCNGVVLFDDTGELLPDGGALPPRQPGRSPVQPDPLSRRRHDSACRPPIVSWCRVVEASAGVTATATSMARPSIE